MDSPADTEKRLDSTYWLRYYTEPSIITTPAVGMELGISVNEKHLRISNFILF